MIWIYAGKRNVWIYLLKYIKAGWWLGFVRDDSWHVTHKLKKKTWEIMQFSVWQQMNRPKIWTMFTLFLEHWRQRKMLCTSFLLRFKWKRQLSDKTYNNIDNCKVKISIKKINIYDCVWLV